jgi:hypothetical protein
MSVTYEVTVPLVVTVKFTKKTTKIVSAHIERGFPGFFSDAEEVMGVWDPANEEWTSAQGAAAEAWSYAREAIAAHRLLHQRLEEAADD